MPKSRISRDRWAQHWRRAARHRGRQGQRSRAIVSCEPEWNRLEICARQAANRIDCPLPVHSCAILANSRENRYHRVRTRPYFTPLVGNAMSSEGSITHWIAELELDSAGEAQEGLWHRYFHRLIGLAR